MVCVVSCVDGMNLCRLQHKAAEVRAQRTQLKRIEDLGAAMEERLILDNRYTEHSMVGLAQQWDQLDQLGMRMQHNLEQQIQAWYVHAPQAPPHGSTHSSMAPTFVKHDCSVWVAWPYFFYLYYLPEL